MLSPEQQAEAEKRLKLMAEEQQSQKNIKAKIKNITKSVNDKLKALSEGDGKKGTQILSKFNQEYLSKFLIDLENKNRYLIESQQKLKSQQEQLKKQKLNAFDDKERFNKSIVQIKDTIQKIQKAIQQSVKQETDKRKKIQQDLDKSIAQIKQKITTFQKQSVQLDAENKTLRQKKEQIIKKMGGLEEQFKSKASEKDQSVKKQKEDLMDRLKQVQNQVNQATELNKKFAQLQKKNFDNKLSIYLRTKKFPDLCNSMQNSAGTIEKCKQQLTRGVHRIQKAIQITKNCQQQSKKINQQCIGRLKVQSQAQQKLKQIKAQKQQIRERILELQNKKKQRQEAATNANAKDVTV